MSSSKFSYDRNQNSLTIENFELLPQDFFGRSISDITGIIGKNGAGKTTLVELVCNVLKGGKTAINTDFLVITEENENFVCHYYFRDKETPKLNFRGELKSYQGGINPLKVIFFSNVYDDRPHSFSKDIIDISIGKALYKQNSFSNRRTADLRNQIDFINSDIFRTLQIDTPSHIQLRIRLWQNRHNKSAENQMFGEASKVVGFLKNEMRERLRYVKDGNRLYYSLCFGLFLDFLYEVSRSFNSIPNMEPFLKELETQFPIITDSGLDGFTNGLMKFLAIGIRRLKEVDSIRKIRVDEFSNSDYYDRVKQQLDFVQNMPRNAIDLSVEYSSEGARNREVHYYTLNFLSNDSRYFVSKATELFEQSTFVDFNWSGISSGHKAYINLFSSIYNEIYRSRTENLFLCIDEGDLYLHPVWQLEFFDKLITVLPSIFQGKIQILLTSHSPFLLSDLPNQCITILDKDSPSHKVDGIDLKTKTFGGNLYDLYSGPFFLGEKRMSSFAYGKIMQLIEQLDEKKKYSKVEKEFFEKYLDMIGDEVIRFRIKQILRNDSNSRTSK